MYRTGEPPTRLAALLAAAGVVLALAGIGAVSASGASAPSLTASKHIVGLPAVAYGKSITLSGHDAITGSKSYTLEANPWPFKAGFHAIAHGKTSGSYSFVVKPSHATRYRVHVGGATSPVLTVYVVERQLHFRCNLCSLNDSPGTHELKISAVDLAPPGPLAEHGPVYFYYALNRSSTPPKTLRLVKKVSLQKSGNRLSFHLSYQVHFPAGVFRFGESPCWRDTEAADGVGLPGHHHCGDSKISASDKYLG